MKVISVVDQRSRAHQLERSLNHFGWEYEIIQAPWRGFATKLLETFNYLKNNPDVKEFVFLDGYDTFVLGAPDDCILDYDSYISGEVNCWPDAHRADLIKGVGKFKYPNSGSYYMKSDLFFKLMNKTVVKADMDDQRIMTDWLLSDNLIIDTQRTHFQTLCGATNEIDYILYKGKFVVDKGYKPIFIHGNGKANMDLIYDLI